MKEKILEFLKKDYLLNVDMIDNIQRNRHNIIGFYSDGVLIEDKVSNTFMISSLTQETTRKLLNLLPKEVDMILLHQEEFYDEVKEFMNPVEELHCNPTVYRGNNSFKINYGEISINLLTLDNLEDVVKYYKNDLCDREYIKSRILANAIYGAFNGNELLGFIGTHAEGSIGLLEVLHNYRKMGIGTILQQFATNQALKENRIPYGQVVIGNKKSTNLQRKLGFELSDKKVIWLMK